MVTVINKILDFAKETMVVTVWLLLVATESTIIMVTVVSGKTVVTTATK